MLDSVRTHAANAAPSSSGKRSAAGAARSDWIDLLPAGVFSGRDGRGPYRNEHPERVIEATRKLGMTAGLPIDFDHAIDLGAPQGQPAPAAGWIKELRSAAGVIQGRVEWTAAGAKALAAKLYRYISPVFEFSADGTVQRLLRAAVTNNPNLHLTAIASAGAGAPLAADENCRRALHQIREALAAPAATALWAARSTLNRAASQAAVRFLTEGEIRLCEAQGTDAARFALTKRDRMTGRPLMMALQGAGNAANHDISDLLKRAMDEIAAFLSNPERLDALQHLVNADALISQAVRQS